MDLAEEKRRRMAHHKKIGQMLDEFETAADALIAKKKQREAQLARSQIEDLKAKNEASKILNREWAEGVNRELVDFHRRLDALEKKLEEKEGKV